jgi:nicotinamidase-related amidase
MSANNLLTPLAGLWTEVCLQMPVLSALDDGYEVYFITDASGGASRYGEGAVGTCS